MNLVSFALRRPISLLMMVVAAALVGFLALDRMPRDIFPDLGVPVLYVAQPYGGMDPAQMEGFIVNYYEYHFLYITGIEHVECKSIQGVALIKLQFHPGTDMAQAMAETVSYVNRARAFMPHGNRAAFRDAVRRVAACRSATSSSPARPKQSPRLQDAALFKVRPLFATLAGRVGAAALRRRASAPSSFSVDPDQLRAYNMSPGRGRAGAERRQHDQPIG